MTDAPHKFANFIFGRLANFFFCDYKKNVYNAKNCTFNAQIINTWGGSLSLKFIKNIFSFCLSLQLCDIRLCRVHSKAGVWEKSAICAKKKTHEIKYFIYTQYFTIADDDIGGRVECALEQACDDRHENERRKLRKNRRKKYRLACTFFLFWELFVKVTSCSAFMLSTRLVRTVHTTVSYFSQKTHKKSTLVGLGYRSCHWHFNERHT